ncbi:hypothetical protein [Streptomyces sp. NBC_01334]|uniref:hypothetical protein n=1 Tax=Streptomyces sp. NBC_01334 TaxID=2903827 RepID=UPI002E13C38F|nr:hypothetical protein OG736_42395 [Streptomyces sp. NBC_01334]
MQDTLQSSGSVEGAVNRIKKIKRQLHGRAGFELLRKMILLQWTEPSASSAPSGDADMDSLRWAVAWIATDQVLGEEQRLLRQCPGRHDSRPVDDLLLRPHRYRRFREPRDGAGDYVRGSRRDPRGARPLDGRVIRARR